MMAADHICQLLIIGGGPAGGYAALTAVESGIDTILVERDPQPGLPLCCAEGISAEGLTRFLPPRPEYIAAEIYQLELHISNGPIIAYRTGARLGFVLDRPKLESSLLDEFRSRGGRLMMQTNAYGIDLSPGRAARVQATVDSGPIEIQADFVIAADGAESLIARKAGLETGLRLDQCDSALQYRMGDIDVDLETLQFCVGSDYSPDGYIWVFPKSEHQANVGIGLNPAGSENKLAKILLDKFVAEKFPRGRIEFVSCGLVPKFIGLDILGIGNLLLAGDAARLIDSLTGAGIARGLHSGKLAAEAVAGAINGGWSRDRLQAHYRAEVEREMGRALKILQLVYPIFRKFTDADWKQLGEFLESYFEKNKAGSIDPAEIIKTALIASPGLWRLARHAFT